MKSVTEKFDTLRGARVRSVIQTKAESIERIKNNDLPKKDVLSIARAAGILAAKKTSELIPYCHPIPIDFVGIEFTLESDRIVIEATVEAVWKTGVEMEALTAALVAALAIFDMLKPVDAEVEILSTKVIEKYGGKSDFKEFVAKDFRAAVIVTSDSTFSGKRKDKSGRMIMERLESYGIKPEYVVLPDEESQIEKKIDALSREGVHLIVTTGGTGLGPRDVTVEATRKVMEREIPGIMEAARAYGQRRTPYAMLSRGLAAQKGRTIILNLPGSSNGTREALAALFPAVFHVYGMMNGGGH
ncbi:MAG: bifunctional molybdenum cofactor biosynthesis protein MoaC/MoaB [Candidatus Omnitrophica bacterium]|nr:bifunctional molybdenum cofactor biosynthesis protein MoaC/MoaB [Candidatus Omnitrophota bacterium]